MARQVAVAALALDEITLAVHKIKVVASPRVLGKNQFSELIFPRANVDRLLIALQKVIGVTAVITKEPATP